MVDKKSKDLRLCRLIWQPNCPNSLPHSCFRDFLDLGDPCVIAKTLAVSALRGLWFLAKLQIFAHFNCNFFVSKEVLAFSFLRPYHMGVSTTAVFYL